ncbi:hypothetical protein DL96DRAFT_1676677 [Flagelloscypha sp. PMI_526]|nr:hypothetical protein DL96DRAFT_1676677 [Flagelloscypha sp. PMI_526]
MTSLPVDLLPNFLCSLDAPDLEMCCLVTGSFYRVARPLLFTHLVLSSRTWKAKCRLLLHNPESHLLKHTRSLTLEVVGIPVFDEDTEHHSILVSLLQRFQGHYLDAFCMDSRLDERRWSNLNKRFQDAISVSILPFTSSIQFLGLTFIPLLTVLAQCSLLQDIRLGAASKDIGDENDIQQEVLSLLPGPSALSFDVFGTSDFEENVSLTKYMLLKGDKIQYLEFGEYCSESSFPISLSFLEPFTNLKGRLLHLSFGPHLHRVIVAGVKKHGSLPLGMFPQLQTLQFAHSARRGKTDKDRWTPWAHWLATMFTTELNREKPIKILHLSMYPDDGPWPITSLDQLVGAMNFQIHVYVDGRGKNTEGFGDTVASVRNSLPSWDGAGKLKFWMRL